MILNILYFAAIGIVFFVLFVEITAWKSDRKNGDKVRAALHRLLRRVIGAILLLLVLILLRYPPQSSLSPNLFLLKILICLVLCLMLMILVVWDSRLVLHAIREQSAQELRTFLEESSPGIGEMNQQNKPTGDMQAPSHGPSSS